MSTKPILFNTDMVRAILEGRKTVTRRVVKAPHLRVLDSRYHQEHPETPDKALLEKLCQPPYQPGDVLYVRETWQTLIGSYIYKADQKPGMKNPGKWRPSIHMPKEAARLFLRVTDVRVERLQSSFTKPICPILELQAEGIDIGETCQECIENYGEPCCVDTVDEDGTDEPECGVLDEVRDDFARLWDSTIKPTDRALYGWTANPWVWRIEFERISREEAERV